MVVGAQKRCMLLLGRACKEQLALSSARCASEVQELRGDSHACCGRSRESGRANNRDPERTETGGGGVDGAECRDPVRPGPD